MKNVSESVLALVKGDKIATNTQEVFMYSPGQETLLTRKDKCTVKALKSFLNASFKTHLPLLLSFVLEILFIFQTLLISYVSIKEIRNILF